MSKPFQRRWNRQYKFLKHDLENIRKALEWGLSADPGSTQLENGLRFISALGPFWGQGGLNREGIARLEKALWLTVALGPSFLPLRAHLLDECGFLYYMQADYHKAVQLLEESIALFRQCGDDWNLIMPLTHLSVCCSHIDQPLSLVAGDESIAIARRVGDPLILAEALFWRGEVAQKCGYPEAALLLGQESLDLFMRLGERGEACRPIVLLWICTYTLRKEDTALIIHYLNIYRSYRQEMEDNGLEYYAIGIEFNTSYFLGNYKEMEDTLQALLDRNLDQNQAPAIWYSRNLGVALKCQGKFQRGAAFSYQSLLLAQEEGDAYGMCCALANLADIAAITGRLYWAVQMLGAADHLVENIPRWLELGPDKDCFDHGENIARESIPAEGFARTWAKGQLMTFEEAVQEARLFMEELSS